MDMFLRVGDQIERNLEGEWYLATIQEIYQKKELMTIRYLDDGNTEEDVPFDETRRVTESKSSINNSISSSESKIETLPRPLAGLIEDDYESRNKHVPTVFIHDANTTDQAIILNGAENKLAAGGGLRALRYLKK